MSKLAIGIDKGHSLSGAGTGANGVVKEVVKNREVGNRLIAMLKEHGHTVIDCSVDYANTSQQQLDGIVQKANAKNLDLFVSLHLNAFNGKAYGVETYIYNGNYSTKAKNKQYAQAIQNELVKNIGWTNRGVKEANLYVLKNTKSMAILVELGFCDNKADMDKWNTEKIAMAIYKGITGQTYVKKVVQPATLYRVRKNWNSPTTQIGAFENLASAKALADKNSGYFVFDGSGKVVYPIVVAKKYLNLKPHVVSWRVYKTNVAAKVGNECGFLAPKTYGGLSYEILEDKGDIKVIQTQSFGRVQIFAPRDNDSTITTTPTYK